MSFFSFSSSFFFFHVSFLSPNAWSVYFFFLISLSSTHLGPGVRVWEWGLWWVSPFSWVDFTNMFTHSFYMCRFQKCKMTDDLPVFFCTFGICACKSFACVNMLLKLTPYLRDQGCLKIRGVICRMSHFFAASPVFCLLRWR